MHLARSWTFRPGLPKHVIGSTCGSFSLSSGYLICNVFGYVLRVLGGWVCQPCVHESMFHFFATSRSFGGSPRMTWIGRDRPGNSKRAALCSMNVQKTVSPKTPGGDIVSDQMECNRFF